MADPNSVANNVAGAIVALLGWSSSADDRKAAVSFLESFKAGDVRILASASIALAKKDSPSEIKLQAFKLLQHLVRQRWEELSPEERINFANIAVELMSESANSSEQWAIKSQTAVLIAEIVRREGLNLWKQLLPSLSSLASNGPIQTELVAMMLRWLPEDITVHNDDLEGSRRRSLLRELTRSLPDILPLLYTLLERHFGAVVSEAERQQFDIAKQHVTAVMAILNAINAYAEWAPLLELANHKIIHGCSILLSYPDFRLHACEFFKLVSGRKRSTDVPVVESNVAMRSVFEILMNVSREFLNRSASNIDESEYKFAENICESMASLGSSYLHCIAEDDSALSLYLQLMFGFFQHFKFMLHKQSLPFWLALMRWISPKPKVYLNSLGGSSAAFGGSFGSGPGVKIDKKRLLNFIHDDICTAILETSFVRLVKKENVLPATVASLGAMELWTDDFEGKDDFGQYRSRLLELVRFVAASSPLIAGAKVAERIISIITNPVLPTQDLAVIESMHLALDNVVNGVFGHDYLDGSSEVQMATCTQFEGLLQHLLALKWTEPAFVEELGHYLESLGLFLKYSPNAVGSVISKLFELLTSLPFAVKDPSTSSAWHARLQICTSFIRIAKDADKSILPHMKGIADTVASLQREGCLRRAEHNIFGEAFIVMGSVAGVQQQQEVLTWLLEPLSQQWVQLDWQNNYLSDPSGLIRLCTESSVMWSIFHTVTFFEKALKRTKLRKAHVYSLSESTGSPAISHPMASHLSWMLPPLLKLLRVIHSLWSPSVVQALPMKTKVAMTMSETEMANLLGEGHPNSSKTGLTFDDMTSEGHAEPNENEIRNWLKGVRESS
ncbi:hypothetical protein SAY86_021044 [Trapa natans]|uniref:Importin N-terminal domain-containing protein n=1 Tax=Trapa natans TaxID=22666 RepID=A0AAN7MJR0_TRANT|nr:hypothetical protein SAY86_021044 [Trapa natans]